jgi:hypothetical protein
LLPVNHLILGCLVVFNNGAKKYRCSPRLKEPKVIPATLFPTIRDFRKLAFATLTALLLFAGTRVLAADAVEGQVLAAGVPVAGSMVTLWAASSGAPNQLAQTKAGDDGRFSLSPGSTNATDRVLYLVAKGGEPKAHKGAGDNQALVFLSVLGSKPPPMSPSTSSQL